MDIHGTSREFPTNLIQKSRKHTLIQGQGPFFLEQDSILCHRDRVHRGHDHGHARGHDRDHLLRGCDREDPKPKALYEEMNHQALWKQRVREKDLR